MSNLEFEIYMLLNEPSILSQMIKCDSLEDMFEVCKDKTNLKEKEFIFAINQLVSNGGEGILIEEISSESLAAYYKIRAS